MGSGVRLGLQCSTLDVSSMKWAQEEGASQTLACNLDHPWRL